MANDRKQFQERLQRWHEHHDAEAYSLPAEEGITAIIVSCYPYYTIKNPDNSNMDIYDAEDFANFSHEANEFAHALGEVGLKSEIIMSATAEDMVDTIQDPEISSIIAIGHGSLSDIMIPGAKKDVFDWRHAGEATTHLKTGLFLQRQCGIFRRDLTVPLGTFVVSDFTSIKAPVGEVFTPESIYEDDSENRKITQVFSAPDTISYELIKQRFPRKT